MTNSSVKEIIDSVRKKIVSTDGIIALAALLTLVVGFFLGSPVGRIVSGMIFVGVIGYFVVRRKGWQINTLGRRRRTQEELYSQSPEGNMKKLLFDDFQSSGGSYVVKEIQEEAVVVPSTKTAQPAPVPREEKPKEFSVSDFFDLDSNELPNDAEPRSEFNFLLNKVLCALKEVLFAHSVVFFWGNKDRKQLVLEGKVTDSQNFIGEKRIPFAEDMVSQVAMTGKPFILGRINPVSEKEVVLYYQSPEYIKSMVCVPVYYFNGAKDGSPVGVIVADSKAEDAFGPETFGLLGNFTKLVSALIKSYTEKYDLLLDSELLASIRRMADRVKSNPTEAAVLGSVAEEAGRLVNWDALTLTMYSDDQRCWAVQNVVTKTASPYVHRAQRVDIDGSIVGRVVLGNKLESIDDLSASSTSRFFVGEPMERKGSFLCIPVSSVNRCYGALTLESTSTGNFAGVEVETMYRLLEYASSLLEVLYLNDTIKDFVPVDQLTGALTKKFFTKKIEEEVSRAEDCATDLAYVSLAIDDAQEQTRRYGREGCDTILAHIVKVVRANTRLYDAIGRLEEDQVGVLLCNTAASDGYLWAEKVRKQIASHIIPLDNRSISVTVSVGVSGLLDGMSKDQLVAGTTQVLHKAMEDGGNLVRMY